MSLSLSSLLTSSPSSVYPLTSSLMTLARTDSVALESEIQHLIETMTVQAKLLQLAGLAVGTQGDTSGGMQTTGQGKLMGRRKSVVDAIGTTPEVRGHGTTLALPVVMAGGLPVVRSPKIGAAKSRSFHALFGNDAGSFSTLAFPLMQTKVSACSRVLRTVLELMPHVTAAGIYRLNTASENKVPNSDTLPTIENQRVWRNLALRSIGDSSSFQFKKKLIKIGPNIGIASVCAAGCEIINVADVERHPAFVPEIDVPISKFVRERAVVTRQNSNMIENPKVVTRALCVPILSETGACIALLQIHEQVPIDLSAPFNSKDVELLESIASTSRSVLLFDEYQQDRERAALLVDVMHSISNILSTDEIVTAVVRIISQHVNAQYVTFYSVDTFISDSGDGLQQQEVNFECMESTLPPLPEQLTGFVCRVGEKVPIASAHAPLVVAYNTKSIVNISEVYQYQQQSGGYTFPSVAEFFDASNVAGLVIPITLKSVLYLPILDLSTNEVIAVVQCVNKNSKPVDDLDDMMPHYTPEDEQLLEYIAVQAASAISRSSEYNHAVLSQQRTQSLLAIVKESCSADEDNLTDVIESILNVCYKMLDAERLSVFMVDELNEELWCKLGNDDMGIRVPFGVGIVGRVAVTGKPMNIPDVHKCAFFDVCTDSQVGFKTQNILCMPVMDGRGKVVAVMQAINKHKGYFTALDQDLMGAVIQEISGLVKRKSTEEAFWSVRNDNAASAMLSMYTNRSSSTVPKPELTSLSSLSGGKNSPKTKHLSPLPSQSSQLLVMGRRPLPTLPVLKPQLTSPSNLRLDLTRVGAEVIRSKRSSLVSPFPSSVLKTLETQSPIGRENDVLSPNSSTVPGSGRRAHARSFAVYGNDPNKSLLPSSQKSAHLTFATLNGSAPSSSQTTVLQDERNNDYLAMMIEEDLRTKVTKVLSPFNISRVSMDILQRWDFDPFLYDHLFLIDCTYFILNYLGLLDVMKIDAAPNGPLHSFLYAVCDHYQENIYHNFYHGFAVFHGVFMILTSALSLQPFFRPLELLGILIAALCHDIDHPGVNNNFLIVTSAPFAVLYNDRSVLENHHAALTFQLLQKRENDIFGNLSALERHDIRKMVIGSILSTDMSVHMSMVTQAQEMGAKKINTDSISDKQLLMNIFVHGSDINNPVLPLTIHIKWTDLCADEFFEQAQTERVKGIPVTPFMANKDSLSKAKSNLNFLEGIVAPLWMAIVDLIPELKPRLEEMKRNRAHWIHVIEELTGVLPISARQSI